MQSTVEPTGLFSGLNVAAIARGVTVDIFATFVASMAILFALGGTDVFSADADIATAAAEALETSTYFFATLISGTLATVLGAFVAAQRAGVHHVRHGGWEAVATTVFTAVLSTACATGDSSPPPLWFEIVSWMLIIPAGVTGGLLAQRRQASSGGPDPQAPHRI